MHKAEYKEESPNLNMQPKHVQNGSKHVIQQSGTAPSSAFTASSRDSPTLYANQSKSKQKSGNPSKQTYMNKMSQFDDETKYHEDDKYERIQPKTQPQTNSLEDIAQCSVISSLPFCATAHTTKLVQTGPMFFPMSGLINIPSELQNIHLPHLSGLVHTRELMRNAAFYHRSKQSAPSLMSNNYNPGRFIQWCPSLKEMANPIRAYYLLNRTFTPTSTVIDFELASHPNSAESPLDAQSVAHFAQQEFIKFTASIRSFSRSSLRTHKPTHNDQIVCLHKNWLRTTLRYVLDSHFAFDKNTILAAVDDSPSVQTKNDLNGTMFDSTQILIAAFNNTPWMSNYHNGLILPPNRDLFSITLRDQFNGSSLPRITFNVPQIHITFASMLQYAIKQLRHVEAPREQCPTWHVNFFKAFSSQQQFSTAPQPELGSDDMQITVLDQSEAPLSPAGLDVTQHQSEAKALIHSDFFHAVHRRLEITRQNNNKKVKKSSKDKIICWDQNFSPLSKWLFKTWFTQLDAWRDLLIIHNAVAASNPVQAFCQNSISDATTLAATNCAVPASWQKKGPFAIRQWQILLPLHPIDIRLDNSTFANNISAGRRQLHSVNFEKKILRGDHLLQSYYSKHHETILNSQILLYDGPNEPSPLSLVSMNTPSAVRIALNLPGLDQQDADVALSSTYSTQSAPQHQGMNCFGANSCSTTFLPQSLQRWLSPAPTKYSAVNPNEVGRFASFCRAHRSRFVSMYRVPFISRDVCKANLMFSSFIRDELSWIIDNSKLCSLPSEIAALCKWRAEQLPREWARNAAFAKNLSHLFLEQSSIVTSIREVLNHVPTPAELKILHASPKIKLSDLKTAIRSLRRVYPSLDIKKGDTIFNLNSFAIHAIYGPINWHYHGERHLLSGKGNQKSLVASFFGVFS